MVWPNGDFLQMFDLVPRGRFQMAFWEDHRFLVLGGIHLGEYRRAASGEWSNDS